MRDLPRPGEAVCRRRCLQLLSAWPLAATARDRGRMLSVGPGERYSQLQSAIDSAASGDVIEVHAGDYHGDVAVIDTPHLTIRSAGWTNSSMW